MEARYDKKIYLIIILIFVSLCALYIGVKKYSLITDSEKNFLSLENQQKYNNRILPREISWEKTFQNFELLEPYYWYNLYEGKRKYGYLRLSLKKGYYQSEDVFLIDIDEVVFTSASEIHPKVCIISKKDNYLTPILIAVGFLSDPTPHIVYTFYNKNSIIQNTVGTKIEFPKPEILVTDLLLIQLVRILPQKSGISIDCKFCYMWEFSTVHWQLHPAQIKFIGMEFVKFSDKKIKVAKFKFACKYSGDKYFWVTEDRCLIQVSSNSNFGERETYIRYILTKEDIAKDINSN